VQSDIQARGAQFVALLRAIYARTQSKQQIGPAASEEEMREDQAQVKLALAQAKTLFPEHDQILLMETEQRSAEGDFDGAMALLEEWVARHEGSDQVRDSEDVTALALKASIVTNQAFTLMSAPSCEEDITTMQTLFSEAASIYEQALEKDPTAIEIMGQYAQLKSLVFSDVGAAVKLLRRAKGFARSKDELLELNQMLLSNEAQYKAITTLVPHIPQTALE